MIFLLLIACVFADSDSGVPLHMAMFSPNKSGIKLEFVLFGFEIAVRSISDKI